MYCFFYNNIINFYYQKDKLQFMIISISGAPGSGKSTIGKKLAKELSWPRYYIGGLRRQAAEDKGLTLAEYNKLGEKDDSTDVEVDEYQRKLGEKEDNFVIEGRTSWYFIPHSFKIYLDVDIKEGARRIFGHLQQKNDRNEDNNLKTEMDVVNSANNRVKSDKIRYEKYYDIDVYNHHNYDFYLDTTSMSEDEVWQAVYGEVIKRLDNRKN